MRAEVKYNIKYDCFQIIDKDHGVIPIYFDTEGEAWDFVVNCEREEQSRQERLKQSCKGGYTVRR